MRINELSLQMSPAFCDKTLLNFMRVFYYVDENHHKLNIYFYCCALCYGVHITWGRSKGNQTKSTEPSRSIVNKHSKNSKAGGARAQIPGRNFALARIPRFIFQSCVDETLRGAKVSRRTFHIKPWRERNNLMKPVGKEELGSGVNLEDLLNLHNLTDHPEYRCLSEGILAGPPPEADGGLYCEQSWDSLLCWPATPAGQLASQPCFDELNGISYDTSRECTPVFCL